MRWQKGMYQCFNSFALGLFGKLLTKLNFAFYDFLIFFMPLPLISSSWAIVNGIVNTIEAILAILSGAPVLATLGLLGLALLKFAALLYVSLFVYGSIAVIKDWKRIKERPSKKIAAMFAYPLFMICLIPICFIAVFKKVEWKPIKHSAAKNIDEIENCVQDTNK